MPPLSELSTRRPPTPRTEADVVATTFGDYSIAVAALVGYLVVFLRGLVLPSRFSFDGSHIQQIAQGIGQSFGDKAYGNTAGVYQLLGLADLPLLAGLIGYTLFLVIVICVWAKIRRNQPRMVTILVAAASLVLGGVYLGYYSKDVMVLPVIAAVMFLPRRWWTEVIIIAMMLGYAAWFRTYWLPVAALYVGYRLVRIERRSFLFIAMSIVLAVVVLGMAIYLVLGTAPDAYRSDVNSVRTLDPNAQSMITPIFTFAEPWSGLLNNLLTALFLVVPVPLLLSGGGWYYAMITLLLSVIWVSTYAGLARLNRLNASNPPARALTSVARSASLLVAFLCVQALFEPDYGSAVRHVTPLLPAAILICGTTLRSLPRHTPLQKNADPSQSTEGGTDNASEAMGVSA